MTKIKAQNIEISNLKDKPELFDQALSLIERELKYPEDQSFTVDFYPLFNKTNAHHLYVAIKDQKVIAHVGLKKRILAFKNYSYPVGFLGGICVASDYQGQGLMAEMLEHIWANHQNEFLCYFLWSDLSVLYEKFNFIEFGLIQESGHVAYGNVPLATYGESPLHNCSPKTFSDICSLYKEMNEKFLHIQRDEQDWNEIKNIKSAKFYYSDSRDYYVAHKGADLKGIIHESTTSNLDKYLAWQPTSNILSSDTLRYMGFIKIANIHLFSKFIHECSQGRLTLTKQDEERVKVLFEEQEYQLGLKQFIQGIFGPNYIEELEKLLPPIVIYGLDSV